MLEQLVQLDQELFLYLNSFGNKFWDAFWLTYTAKLHWIPFYAILAYLLYKRLNTKMFVLTLVVIILMISFTDQGTNFVKDAVERPRPCYQDGVKELMRLVRNTCGGFNSFFSGHSSNAMALAIFVGMVMRKKYKYLIYLMIVWAVCMGYSRIYIGVHYPLDVLCGFLFGGLAGYGFYRLDRYIQTRFTLVESSEDEI